MSTPTAGVLPPSHGRDGQAQQAATSATDGAGGSEFAETSTVQLEWRLTGLRQMYESSKGESKSKCIKSAVFGDADNLWEVLWYPNSGVQGGEFASLYLSCVPTTLEREQGIGGKWSRKGKWWFRFEVKVPEERKGGLLVLTSKDASDHQFAVKTANWGWQQFAKRDQLFLHPAVVQADSFVIVCTISAQPQLPAGYWLGLSTPPRGLMAGTASGTGTVVGFGSWAGGDGANGGVAGGTMAAGGPKRVVPRDLVSSVGDMLDDPLYSDIEFVIPAPRIGGDGYDEPRPPPRRIYANKKLLNRCQYFDAMFHGGFDESESALADMDQDPTLDLLSDSDEEDEAQELLELPQYANPVRLSRDHSRTTTRDTSPAQTRRLSDDSGEQSPVRGANADDGSDDDDDDDATDGASDGSSEETDPADASTEGSVSDGTATAAPDVSAAAEPVKRESRTRTRSVGNAVLGPKKSRVVIRDAAWSTWWAVLYFLYTDIIYFAPLSSSFISSRNPRHSRSNSTTSISGSEPRNRREWVAQWLAERGMSSGLGASDLMPGTATSASFNFATLSGFPTPSEGVTTAAVGPRPVSAKSVYRLADKLGLQALKLRAYNHIIYWLKADNIPAEVFSRFSCTFEDVRKVQIAMFLKHWSEIKKSESMQLIWKQIREGKHVGFEEVISECLAADTRSVAVDHDPAGLPAVVVTPTGEEGAGLVNGAPPMPAVVVPQPVLVAPQPVIAPQPVVAAPQPHTPAAMAVPPVPQIPPGVSPRPRTPGSLLARSITPAGVHSRPRTPANVHSRSRTPNVHGRARTPTSVHSRPRTPASVHSRSRTPAGVHSRPHTPTTQSRPPMPRTQSASAAGGP